LEDQWEMDKAISKNSRIPHLLMRYPAAPRRSYLTSDSGNVAIIYPKALKRKAEHLRRAARDAFNENIKTGLVDIKNLYTQDELIKGHDLYDVLEKKLSKYSYAIFLGTGPHHSTIIRALVHDKQRIVVEQTIGMAHVSEQIDLPHRARGLGCIRLMKDIISSSEERSPVSDVLQEESSQNDFLVTLQELWNRDAEQHFEELPAFLEEGPLNVFFSAGTLQDMTKGARHQRVRNIHDAFLPLNTLNVFGRHPLPNRRLKAARKMLAKGRRAGIFYGENSTSPMDRTVNTELSDFLKEFSRCGGRSMWFVRDLHWLEKFSNSPWTAERRTEMISDGLYELHEVGDRSDILAAPSHSAGEGFNALLEAVEDKPREWHPLPPAVQPQNILDDRALISRDGITLLYTGGISEIYGMELYLSALSQLSESVLLDFVVRKPEAAPLREALDRLGLLDTERTRILHTTMDLYRPRTSRTLGMVLLDSRYAKFAFPYKTVTMIERGYPILCFSDMGIADFVTSNRLGCAVERSAEAIHEGISALIKDGAPGIEKIRKEETWENRAKEVYRLLSN